MVPLNTTVSALNLEERLDIKDLKEKWLTKKEVMQHQTDDDGDNISPARFGGGLSALDSSSYMVRHLHLFEYL